jgi:deoxycytidine triphosphate deaminase
MSMRHILSPQVPRNLLSNVQEGDSQPNAVDLRVDKMFRLKDEVFVITDTEKKHRGSEEIKPDSNSMFCLEPGVYEIIMENIVQVPENYAGWVITRSTLNRNGCHITSGLYDSGYNGVMAGLLHVAHGPAAIEKGARVGQFLMFEAETLSMYDGDYGVGKEHDAKYGDSNGN